MWKSWPAVAGLHGSPVLPQLKQISLYCFSLQQLSWQLESYPGWKTTENREQANKKVNKHFYHLTDRTFTHNFQLKHHVSYLPLCVGVDIYSASLLTLTNAAAFHPFVCSLLYYCSNIQFWLHHGCYYGGARQKQGFTANVFTRQSNCGGYLARWERVQIIARLMCKYTHWEGKQIRVLARAQGSLAK